MKDSGVFGTATPAFRNIAWFTKSICEEPESITPYWVPSTAVKPRKPLFHVRRMSVVRRRSSSGWSHPALAKVW